VSPVRPRLADQARELADDGFVVMLATTKTGLPKRARVGAYLVERRANRLRCNYASGIYGLPCSHVVAVEMAARDVEG
jgi:hypothetical protein